MRVAPTRRIAQLQIVPQMDVRRPIEQVDGVPLVVRFRPPGDRRPLPLPLPPLLLRLRQRAPPPVRQHSAVVAQQRRWAVVRVFVEVRQEVWAKEVSVF
ncbi:hypothetical protein L1049_000211 [Liquidambar formosana]|uniref:Uncharacterized protein n=1 Tax=Liquidambar formosana TaxID=63359 RepID=A0AAP0NB15_LIQFO